MQKTSRSRHRSSRATSIEMEEDAPSNQSYFQWREQTVRMRAVTPVAQPAQSSAIARMFRRITGKG